MTICRPPDDIIAEKQDTNEDYDPEDDDERELNLCGTKDCKCSKSPKDSPHWKWLITRKGLKMVAALMNEAMKRDQDAMDQYQYNDFSGYGFQEVVENHVRHSLAHNLYQYNHGCFTHC